MTGYIGHAGRALTAAALALTLAGCAGQTQEEKRITGAVVGGASGAAIGSLFGGGTGKIVATGAGAVLGAIAGGKVAEGM